MWVFLTFADGCEPEDVDDITLAVKKYLPQQQDTNGATTLVISVHDQSRKEREQTAWKLPFLPVATIYTSGPGRDGSIVRKETYYLTRNDQGSLVRKLVSRTYDRSDDGSPPDTTSRSPRRSKSKRK